MAENKKSFIAYSDWKETFDSLPDDKAGQLIKHIFAYVNDDNPETDDILINAVFANIKNTLKRDLKKWEVQYNQRVEAGKKSAEARKRNAALVNERSISSTVSDSVSVTVSDNVNKEKKYIYNQFYDEQLELSDNDPDYKLLISWLFGDNIYMEPLEKVLSMKKQIRWDQFPGLLKMHKDSGVKVKPILEDLENWLMKNPKAKNSTVIGTLRTFIKNQQNKK
jgi:hypothetical protein